MRPRAKTILATLLAMRPATLAEPRAFASRHRSEVFAEMHRVLRPGGQAIMSFSNRCFPSKAVAMWLGTGDAGRRKIVGAYFALSPPNGWSEIEALDITELGVARAQDKAKEGGNPLMWAALWLKQSVGDPMFVVRASKK